MIWTGLPNKLVPRPDWRPGLLPLSPGISCNLPASVSLSELLWEAIIRAKNAFSIFYVSIYSARPASSLMSHLSCDSQYFQTVFPNWKSQQQPRTTTSRHSPDGSWMRQLQKVTHGDLIHLPLTQTSAPTAHVATAQIKTQRARKNADASLSTSSP